MKRQDRLKIAQTIPWTGKEYRGSFLLDIIQKNNCKTIAEVGVKYGRTTFFLLDNVPDLTIYAIDVDISKFYNPSIKEKYTHRLIPLQGLSYIVSNEIPNGILDLVFIDADHSYEAVKKDISAYSPKLKCHGILTGHDIDYPGVYRAVNELVNSYDVGPNNVWIKKIEKKEHV